MPKVTAKRKTIGIVGSRRRDGDVDYAACTEAFLRVYCKGDRLVSGGCELGAGRFAQCLAKQYGCTITIHYPRRQDLDQELVKVNPRAAWAKINYARNTLIAEDADILIAVVAKDRKGGTEDTVRKATKLGKRVITIT